MIIRSQILKGFVLRVLNLSEFCGEELKNVKHRRYIPVFIL